MRVVNSKFDNRRNNLVKMSMTLILNDEVRVYLRPLRPEYDGLHECNIKPKGKTCSVPTNSDVKDFKHSGHHVGHDPCCHVKKRDTCGHTTEQQCCPCAREERCCRHIGEKQRCQSETSKQCEHIDEYKCCQFENQVHSCHVVGDERPVNVHDEDTCCCFGKDLRYSERHSCHGSETSHCTFQDEKNYRHVATCCTLQCCPDTEHGCHDGQVQRCDEQNGHYSHRVDKQGCCSCCRAEHTCNVADKACCICDNTECCSQTDQEEYCSCKHVENNNHVEECCCKAENEHGGYLKREQCSWCQAREEGNGRFTEKKTNYCCREKTDRCHFVRNHNAGHFVEKSSGRREREGRGRGRRLRTIGVKLYFKQMSAAVRHLHSLVKRRDASDRTRTRPRTVQR